MKNICKFTVVFLWFIMACNSNNPKNNLLKQITALEQKSADSNRNNALSKLYLEYYNAFPQDTLNVKHLFFVAESFMNNNMLDSAAHYYQTIFKSFSTHKLTQKSMLMYASVQKNIGDQCHWLRLAHEKNIETKEGEQALLSLAMVYENNGQPAEALTIYEQYVVLYPKSALIEDVKISIQNINSNKSPEDLVKEFEANRKKNMQ